MTNSVTNPNANNNTHDIDGNKVSDLCTKPKTINELTTVKFIQGTEVP